MDEKRKHKRFVVKGKIGGRVLLASDINIIDISIGGIHFTCHKRILTNSRCRISITHQNNSLNLEGIVVRSVFRGIEEKSKQSLSVYEVAMEFTNLSDDQINTLRQFTTSLNNEKTQ